MGMNIKSARADVATRATDEGSCGRDQLHPQHNNNTAPTNRQAWDLETEIRLIDALIAVYNKKQYRRQSRKIRELIYNDGVRLVCSYPFSPAGNEYGRKALAEMLRC